MSKKFLFLLGILLTIIVGAILYAFYCCNCGAGCGENAAKANSSTAVIPDKIKDLKAESSDSAALKHLQEARVKLNSNPVILHFEINRSETRQTPEETQKIEELVSYLKDAPEAEVIVTGHTDNSGEHNVNIKLGQDRANFVKAYLVQKGISEVKITSVSKGPDDPVASNTTPEGRAENRRAVILIK